MTLITKTTKQVKRNPVTQGYFQSQSLKVITLGEAKKSPRDKSYHKDNYSGNF